MPDIAPDTVFAVVLPPEVPVAVVPWPGLPGPRGPAGLGGELYEYVQDTPAASWLIEHPGGREPAGLVILVDDQEVIADVHYDGGLPRCTVIFAAPVVGRALFL